MLFNALHNFSFFFKNQGLLEFTPIPCSSLSPNLSHLHYKIVYSSAKLLWKVRPETISASICSFSEQNFGSSNTKILHFTAFCFQLPLSLISLFLFLFSPLPLSFSPSLPSHLQNFSMRSPSGNRFSCSQETSSTKLAFSCHVTSPF